MLEWLKSRLGSGRGDVQEEVRPRTLVPHVSADRGEGTDIVSDRPRFRIARGPAGARDQDFQTRLRQSYGSAQPVADVRFFAGRKDTLNRIISALEGEGTHIVMYGERGIGKTSMLHVLADMARDARYEVIYDSCSADTRFDTISRSILGRLPLIYHESTSLTSDAVEGGGTFAGLLPEGSVGAREMSDLLTHVVGTKVLIILDEYDRVEDSVFRRQTAELIKNLSDRRATVHLLIAGVAEDLDELIDYIPSIRRNIAAIEIPAMSADEVREIIRIGTDVSGLPFADGSPERVIYYAGGSPYVARLLCLHAASHAHRAGSKTVTEAIVDQAARQVVNDWHDRMPSAVKRKLGSGRVASDFDLLVSAALACHVNQSRFSLEDIRNAYVAIGKVPPIDLARRVEANDLITAEGPPEDRLFRLSDPGLGAYLRMQSKLPADDAHSVIDLTKAVG